MSVKPVAWMYTQHIEGVPVKFFPPVLKTEQVVGASESGWTETPLYSAPAPELAEKLQRVVDCFKVSDSGICHFTIHDSQAFIAECRSLLARITPK